MAGKLSCTGATVRNGAGKMMAGSRKEKYG